MGHKRMSFNEKCWWQIGLFQSSELHWVEIDNCINSLSGCCVVVFFSLFFFFLLLYMKIYGVLTWDICSDCKHSLMKWIALTSGSLCSRSFRLHVRDTREILGQDISNTEVWLAWVKKNKCFAPDSVDRFVLLKLIQKFGQPERFDFMYHISGPEKGRPKGYCFVTYPTKEVRQWNRWQDLKQAAIKIKCLGLCKLVKSAAATEIHKTVSELHWTANGFFAVVFLLAWKVLLVSEALFVSLCTGQALCYCCSAVAETDCFFFSSFFLFLQVRSKSFKFALS